MGVKGFGSNKFSLIHCTCTCICPTLFDIGKGMSYISGPASLAATHRGKVKNIQLTTLRDAKQNVDHRACILDFEREAIAFDNQQGKQATNDGEHLVEYTSIGHPYVRDYSLTTSLN